MPDLSYDKRYPYVTFTNRQVSYSSERLSNWWRDELIQHRSRLIGCKVKPCNNRLRTLNTTGYYTIKDLSEDGCRILIAENNRWYNCNNFYVYHRKNEPPPKWFKKFAKEFL